MEGRADLTFHLLGQPEAFAGARRVDLPTGGAAALLAYLLLRPGEPVSRDRLIDELWGESPPRSAPNAVQVYVSALRRVLAPDLLVTVESGYRLDVAPEAVDVHRFRALVRDGRRALEAEEHATALVLFERALALWKGTPFGGLEERPFAAHEAAELEEVRVDALEGRLEAALELGRHAEVVTEVGELIEQEPGRESLRAILMLALYRSGRQADALAAYRDAQTLLDEEYGLEPSRRLKDLQAAILRQDPALEAPSAAPARRLPVPPTPLIGRAAELAHAEAALRAGTRLLTLVGPGGIGKTRLGLEIARRLEAEIPGIFVPLESVREPERVEDAIASALGFETNRPLVEQLDDRPRVVVLDNFEQVVEAAPLLSAMLAATTRLRLIVTSRAVLRLTGEEALTVPPLPRDEAAALFIRRAAAVGGRLDEETDAATVRAICACLDDLPLALELAAARTKLFAPATLLERLSQRLDVLTTGPRDAPARQRTMRAAIDWSFDLLTPREQAILETLAVFAGGASLEAAAAVCEAPPEELVDVFESLIEKSLLQPVDAGAPRVHMLEVVREYALEKTDGSERGAEIRARHTAFFRELADDADDRLDSAEQGEVADRLDLELDNLRGALTYAVETDPVSAVQLAAALRGFWRLRGHLREGVAWIDRVLALEPDADPDLMSALWNGLGILLGEQALFDRALEAFERSAEYAREGGQPLRLARTLSNLGNIYAYRGDYAQARELYLEALATNRGLGELRFVAKTLQNLGATLMAEQEIREAVATLSESLDIAQKIGVPQIVADSARELARALVLAGDTERAAAEIARSIEFGARVDNVNGIAQSLDAIAGLAASLGDEATAAEAYTYAERLRGHTGARQAPDEIRWLGWTGFRAPEPPPDADGLAPEPTLAEAAALATALLDRVPSRK